VFAGYNKLNDVKVQCISTRQLTTSVPESYI